LEPKPLVSFPEQFIPCCELAHLFVSFYCFGCDLWVAVAMAASQPWSCWAHCSFFIA